MNERLKQLCEPYMDTPAVIQENNLRYSPLLVDFVDRNLFLYFYHEGEFEEWVLKYMELTGDIYFRNINLFELYSQERVDGLNDHEPGLGDSIVQGSSRGFIQRGIEPVVTYYFVKRFLKARIDISWSKGGF